MSVLKASVWLNALSAFRPDIAKATSAAWQGKTQDNAVVRPHKAELTSIPSESVDYAVTKRCFGSSFPIKMVPLDAGWSDFGAWDAVSNALPKDDQANVHSGDVLTADSRNTVVHASSRIVSLVRVSDLVVETPNAVLVADKTRSQCVKHIVTHLQTSNREEHTLHRTVHLSWGWKCSIDEGGRFKVKRIQVNAKRYPQPTKVSPTRRALDCGERHR
jgi:mannose-1-phosphate guanylyltransferase/mannose-6-phosphate isomerase